MDQINQQYKKAVLSLLGLQTQGITYNAPELSRQLISDPAGHCLVLSLGWLDELFQSEIVMHLLP